MQLLLKRSESLNKALLLLNVYIIVHVVPLGNGHVYCVAISWKIPLLLDNERLALSSEIATKAACACALGCQSIYRAQTKAE